MSIIQQSKTLLEQGSYAKAAELLSPLEKNNPNNFDIVHLLGLAKHSQGDHVAAINLLERALVINPNSSAAHHNIAGFYRIIGEMGKAEASYRKAIHLKPNYGEAYQGLTEIIKFKIDEPEINALTGPLLEKINTELNKQVLPKTAHYLHFAAGKINDDLCKYDEAFNHYLKGNKLAGHTWSQSKENAFQKNVKNAYSAEYFIKSPSKGLKTDSPIFIIGMPRSGSTLVEQILSSHPDIFGLGEISDIQAISEQIHNYSEHKQPYPVCINELPGAVYEGLGKAYMQRTLSLKGDSKTVKTVNKFLFNFRHLGLISDLLPQAKIIHTVRHPLDTCLSCFFQNFSSKVNWSFNLEHIVEYYRAYREMMTHWKSVLPSTIFEIKYENLVAQPEEYSKALIEHCGLPWDEACLNFHLNSRKVQTASFLQVRQPVYQGSKGRWSHYEKHISILAEGLHDYIEEHEEITR